MRHRQVVRRLSATQTLPRSPTHTDPSGPAREVKKALESHWAGAIDADTLLRATADAEAGAWRAQADAGIDLIGIDGTLYDQVLDATFQLGLVPPRFHTVRHQGGRKGGEGRRPALTLLASTPPCVFEFGCADSSWSLTPRPPSPHPHPNAGPPDAGRPCYGRCQPIRPWRRPQPLLCAGPRRRGRARAGHEQAL